MTAEAAPSQAVSTSTTYEKVRHNKLEGTLVLTANHLVFKSSNGSGTTEVSWGEVIKHQVSPASHAKALLKINLKNGKGLTFGFSTRVELDQVRREVTARLQRQRTVATAEMRKRRHSELSAPSKPVATSFGEMDATALAVTRSSLLAANPTLRTQHQYLVSETQTVTEDDFWKTHQSMLEEEYAKICGTTRAGTSSLMQSYLPLQGRVTLGVEEMRQIFILYPAVHKAYEEKVPLELSDEQFWRKYLESEFFHRDRGRLGTAARNQHGVASKETRKDIRSAEEDDARAAAVGSDDLFSRYDSKLRDESNGGAPARKWGTRLAVGQFDLASTSETERGHLLEGQRDYFPPNTADDGKGARVIKKYNRHWAMVLNPEEAVAGSNLMDVARHSVEQSLEDDEAARAHGGVHQEMQRLVGYANATQEDANHVQGFGTSEEDVYEKLTLKNVEAYYSGQQRNSRSSNETEEETLKRQAVFARAMAAKVQAMAAPLLERDVGAKVPKPDSFPPPALGRELLSALTKKMAVDSQTDADTLQVVNSLPEDFKKRLHTFFSRSSELLRHFFGLRRLQATGQSQNSKKLARIVQGLEAVYREMEGMRKELPQTETGEVMRKMCIPIMDQLDWAFQLNRDRSGAGSGGFVTVEEL